MKYVVLIMDGAAGQPLSGSGKTSLEMAKTPNLDAMARSGQVGMARTVPPGMEPSSACACMSVLGYDPLIYYRGRAGIEAISMNVPVSPNDVVFRCNLVTVEQGKMKDYSCGHISNEEAAALISSLNEGLGSGEVRFYAGVSYRHILRLSGHEDTLEAECTPPHDISGREVAGYLPRGKGSELLLDLMRRSEPLLAAHPVNRRRITQGKAPATTIWLFWGTGRIPLMPPFKQAYGLNAAMTSGVDLLRGLASMMSMDVLHVPGVSDGLDNDYGAQIQGAIDALKTHDLVVVHVEAPDEAGHSGSAGEKVRAIERIDAEMVSRLLAYKGEIRILLMPDHPTPVNTMTHNGDPVPFVLWGPGFRPNGATRFTEAEGRRTGLIIDPACDIMRRLAGGIK